MNLLASGPCALDSGPVGRCEGYRKSLPQHIRVLFDRFQLFDLAIKVVGVGSVGTYCALGLFMAADDDPIFLQVKEARKSVLEPYAGLAQEPRREGGSGPASHAGGERHFPWLDARSNWPRLLFPPASRCENLSDPGRLGPHDFEGIWQALRLGACAGPCAIRRPGDDCWLHGLQYDIRRRSVRIRG